MDQRELFAERPGMLARLECDQRVIEAIGLPIGLSSSPIVCVAGEAEENVMMTDVLRALIVITASRSGCSNQR